MSHLILTQRGSALLFERRKFDPAAAGGDEALYAVNANGGDFRQITYCCGECWSDGEAAWSPSRDRIAFRRGTGPRSAPGPSWVAIDATNADGGLADEIDAARAEAVKGLRAYGYSWAESGSRRGITRQAAQQCWG